MTASKTSALQLMSPTTADQFDPADFAETFAILDDNPGILTVANQASRPTGWSSDQHGRHVWQADTNIMWVWNQPSSVVAGVWTRRGGFGHLGGASNPTQINSTAQTWTAAPTAVAVNVMVPGGRPVLVMYNWEYIANDHSRQITVNLIANSTSIMERRHTGSAFGINPGLPPDAKSYYWIYSASPTQQQINFQLRVRALDPAVVGPDQGGGTSTIWSPRLDVIEV